MKVILRGFFGKTTVPASLLPDFTDNKLWRFDEKFVSKLENLSRVKSEKELTVDNVICKEIEGGKQYIFKVSEPGYLNDIFALNIVEVDTSRPWTIQSGKAEEKVVYLDLLKLVNKDINFYM